MIEQYARWFRDPDTAEGPLGLEVLERDDVGRVKDGRLVIAGRPERWFRIENYIIDLLPDGLRDNRKQAEFAARYGLPCPIASKAGEARKPTSEEIQIEFFKCDSAVYDKDVSNLPFYRIFDELYMHAWIASLPPAQFVLDIGGGTGRQAIPLAEANHRVLSCDISEDMLNKAVAKAVGAGVLDRVLFLLCNAQDLPLADASFDAAICYGSLHHMSSPDDTIRHTSRVLKPTGRWFSVDPHASPLRFAFELAMQVKKLYAEVAADDVHFTTQQIVAMFKAAGIGVQTRYSTFILPHLVGPLPYPAGRALLRWTDRLFGSIPLVNRCGGIIVVEGARRG